MLEIETDSLHLALAEENIFDCIQSDERAAWEKCGKNQYKDFNKRDLKDSGDRLISQYRRVIDEAVNLTSTKNRFQSRKPYGGQYEQTKKGFSYFQKDKFKMMQFIQNH